MDRLIQALQREWAFAPDIDVAGRLISAYQRMFGRTSSEKVLLTESRIRETLDECNMGLPIHISHTKDNINWTIEYVYCMPDLTQILDFANRLGLAPIQIRFEGGYKRVRECICGRCLPGKCRAPERPEARLYIHINANKHRERVTA